MPWGDFVPVDTPDLAVIGLWTAAELSLVVVVLYVTVHRRWPGYIAKNYGLLLCTALAGMLVNLAAAMRYGWWGTLTNASEAPLGCNVEAWLLWSGVGGFFACAFLRVYRYHNVLVLHDGRMCPLPLQLATLLLPFLVPPAFFTGHTGAVAFDQDTQECERQPNKSETFAFGIMVVMASATVALACSLRRTKLQAPEEVRAAVAISVTLVLAVIAIPLLHEGLHEDPDERRRAILVASTATTLGVIAAPLVGPVKGFVLAHDERLKARDDFGFSRSRQPGDAQKISQDRMQVNALASSPGGRYVPGSSAMAWFFRDSLDRESLHDPLLLQAATMRILNKYVREGAPMSIPLSPSCREQMLTSKAWSAVIFERARQEVMEKLGGAKVFYCSSPTNTVVSCESGFAAGGTGGDADGTTDQHPEPVVVKLPTKAKSTRNAAAVSGGQLKRIRLGAIGGPSDLSTAFGLRPSGRRGGGGSREGSPGPSVGRRGAAKLKGYGGDGLDPFENSWSPRRDEMSAVELPDIDPADSFDDLDPFQGLQGTLDFNFADSIASIPGLAESLSFTGKRPGSFANDKRRIQKKNNQISISESSSSEDDVETHVVNPLFVGELKQAVARQGKSSE